MHNRISKIELGFALIVLMILVAAIYTGRGKQNMKPVSVPKVNLLSIPNGSLVVFASSTFSQDWSAFNLVDGSTRLGWCSASKALFPHAIVFELARPHAVTGLAVDNTGTQDSVYSGISSRKITVYGSNQSESDGFSEIVSFEVPAGSRKEVKLEKPVTVQWLKFVVNANWGHAEYTEIMELEAFGAAVGPLPKADFAGVYQTNYGLLKIEQDGFKVSGCYDYAGGKLFGNLDGRIMRLDWRQEKDKRFGTAILVLSNKGDSFKGFWYENDRIGNKWFGKRGGNPPKCSVAK